MSLWPEAQRRQPEFHETIYNLQKPALPVYFNGLIGSADDSSTLFERVPGAILSSFPNKTDVIPKKFLASTIDLFNFQGAWQRDNVFRKKKNYLPFPEDVIFVPNSGQILKSTLHRIPSNESDNSPEFTHSF